MTTVTFNDAANVDLRSHNAVWATARGGSNLASYEIQQLYCGYTGTEYYIDRLYLLFATATLPDDAIIASAFIRIPGSLGGNPNSQSVHIVASTAEDSPTTGDWADVGSVDWGNNGMGNFSGGNLDINLNATGLTNISKTGNSKFALVATGDLNNSGPAAANYITITGTVILSITYDLPVKNGHFQFL